MARCGTQFLAPASPMTTPRFPSLSRYVLWAHVGVAFRQWTDVPAEYAAGDQCRDAHLSIRSSILSRIPDLQKFPTHGIFFQAPLGVVTDDLTSQAAYGPNYSSMDNALNTWGYFVETSDYDERPSFITNKITPLRWRCRLMEMRLPSEKMGLYDTYALDKSNDWFQTWLAIPNGSTPPRPTRVLAENVMALIIWPKLSKQDEDLRWTRPPGVDAHRRCSPQLRLQLESSTGSRVPEAV